MESLKVSWGFPEVSRPHFENLCPIIASVRAPASEITESLGWKEHSRWLSPVIWLITWNPMKSSLPCPFCKDKDHVQKDLKWIEKPLLWEETFFFPLWFPCLVLAMCRMNPIPLLPIQNIWKQLTCCPLSAVIIFKLRTFFGFKNFGDLLAPAGSPSSSWFLAPSTSSLQGLQKSVWAHTMLPDPLRQIFHGLSCGWLGSMLQMLTIHKQEATYS